MASTAEVTFYLSHLCALVAVLLYGVCTGAYLLAALQSRQQTYIKAERYLFAATLCHGIFLCAQSVSLFAPSLTSNSDLMLPNSALSISFVSWLLPTLYLFAKGRLPLRGLGVFLAPMTMTLMIVSSLWFHTAPVIDGSPLSALLAIHILFSLLGHVAFVAAFCVSVALIVQETLLKRRSFALVLRVFPPLRLLDTLNGLLISVGVCAMGIGVLLGIAFAMQQQNIELLWTGRVFWSGVTMALYAGLALMIFFRGFRGRRAAWISVLSYGIVVLSFASSRLLGAGFHVH